MNPSSISWFSIDGWLFTCVQNTILKIKNAIGKNRFATSSTQWASEIIIQHKSLANKGENRPSIGSMYVSSPIIFMNIFNFGCAFADLSSFSTSLTSESNGLTWYFLMLVFEIPSIFSDFGLDACRLIRNWARVNSRMAQKTKLSQPLIGIT